MGEHTRRGVAVATAAALAASTACGGDNDPQPENGSGGAGQAYFAEDRFLGETVTISPEVTDVYTPHAFGIDGSAWGDESVLVLSEPEVRGIGEGDLVRITGSVREFAYPDYAVDYGLSNAGLYERYGGERFLTAIAVDESVTTP